jgi:alpha-L-fucosidase
MPQPAVDVLRHAGEWLKVNGEAVYGAGPTPFGDELGEPSARGAKDLRGQPLVLPHNEYRFTTKPGKLFVTFFAQPRVPFTLPKMQNAVKRAYRLADGQALELREVNGERQIVLAGQPLDPMATVVVVEIEGATVRR